MALHIFLQRPGVWSPSDIHHRARSRIRLIRRVGSGTTIRVAALLAAVALAALAAAPSWSYAIPAAGLTGLGVSVLTPLCFASAGRLQPGATEAVLARLNLFNYAGVISGAAASGLLGASGHFRLAYSIPALLVLVPVALAPAFTKGAGRMTAPA